MSELFQADPELFRQMNVPYESLEEAGKQMEGFQADLAELRKKYKIPSLYFIAYLTAKTPDGEGDAMLTGGFGNQLLFESMTAFAFGQEGDERQARLARLEAKAIKRGKKGG